MRQSEYGGGLVGFCKGDYSIDVRGLYFSVCCVIVVVVLAGL